MNQIGINEFKTVFGVLLLASFEGRLVMCDWKWRRMRSSIDKRIQDGLGAIFTEAETDMINQAKTQLNEYFSGIRREFDLPLLFVGTDFQKSVWKELQKISYGTTETYIGLAGRMGKTDAVRAVAAANGANAISIIVPCHRIIGSHGDLTGYAGGVDVKRRLLELEKMKDNNLLFET